MKSYLLLTLTIFILCLSCCGNSTSIEIKAEVVSIISARIIEQNQFASISDNLAITYSYEYFCNVECQIEEIKKPKLYKVNIE